MAPPGPFPPPVGASFLLPEAVRRRRLCLLLWRAQPPRIRLSASLRRLHALHMQLYHLLRRLCWPSEPPPRRSTDSHACQPAGRRGEDNIVAVFASTPSKSIPWPPLSFIPFPLGYIKPWPGLPTGKTPPQPIPSLRRVPPPSVLSPPPQPLN